MPLITSSIPNLINGVSQQPPALRLASQGATQINCMPSPVEGLKKRSPMSHIAKLWTTSAGSNRPFVHLVDRDGVVQYMVVIQDGAIRVCDLDGTVYTTDNGKLTVPDGVSYLDITGTPSETFRVASLADYTFIVNREKSVAMSTDTSPLGLVGSSMIFIKGANYDTTYKANIDGTEKEYTTMPAGGRKIPASYSQTGTTTVTVTATNHGLVAGDEIHMTFAAGETAVAGTYTVLSGGLTANQFSYTASSSITNSGNCEIKYDPPLSTVTIAEKLAEQLNDISGFTVTNDEYIIHITKDAGNDSYTIGSSDNKTGEDTKAIKGVVDDMDDLPIMAKNNFIVKVQGSKSTDLDDYYVRFVGNLESTTLKTASYSQSGTTVTVTATDHGFTAGNKFEIIVAPGETAVDGIYTVLSGGLTANQFTYTAGSSLTDAGSCQVRGHNFGEGRWKETVAPGIPYRFDGSTMPHTLIREVANNGDVSFVFRQYKKKDDNDNLVSAWGERLAGDETTSPNPSFINTDIPVAIQNLNLFRNRLVLLAGENVILSAADAYERFWPETVQTNVPSDPIDLTTGGTSINFLVSSVAFANTLLLFSRHAQFRLDAGINTGSSMTPDNATITAMTAYDMAAGVDPVAVGRNLYFPIPKGPNFSGVREFFLPDSSGSVPLSEDITSSVPRYIPSNLCSFIASISEEALILISKDQPKRLYLYKFYFEDDTKLQSSWSYWEVSGAKTILGAGIIDSDLYAVVEYSDGVYLEHVVIRPENVDAGTEMEILLDRKTTEPASGSLALINAGALGVQTTITLPYPIASGAEMVVVGRYEENNTLLRHGQVIEPLSQTSNSITVPGDLKTVVGGKTPRFFIGERYSMTYEFSTPYIKEQPPGGGVALAAGPKLQMRTWTVVFDESSAFELKVTPASRDTNTYPYNGIILGQSPPLIGDPSILTGTFRVPVMASNIDTKIELSSTSPLPCRFQSAEWEGFYHTRAKRQ